MLFGLIPLNGITSISNSRFSGHVVSTNILGQLFSKLSININNSNINNKQKYFNFINKNGLLTIIVVFSLLSSQLVVVEASGTAAGSTTTDNSEGSKEGGECTSLGCSQKEASTLVLLFLIVVLLSVMVVYGVIRLDLHYIPESIAVIVYGVVIGIIGKYIKNDFITHVEHFSPQLFFLFLLPFIIFETGFSVHRIEFFKNITPIITLATIGTLISFLGTSFGLYLVGKLGLSMKLPIFDSLLFGSIACATDPVATLGIFKALDVDPKLYMIILGESILNDAVSIILVQAVNSYSLAEIWKPILLFFGVSIASVILGVLIALCVSLLLKWLNIGKYPAIETLFVILFAYISYLLADAISLSGILSTFFCGITFQQYGYNSLSSDSKHNCTQLLRMGSFVCETITFIYIGMSLPLHQFSFKLTFLIWAIIFIIVFRAAAVYPIIAVLNKLGLSSIPISIQTVVVLSGLRGAISFSLSMSDELTGDYRPEIQTAMLILVFFTIFVFGLTTYPALKAFKIKSSDTDISLDFIGKPLHIDSRFNNIGSLFSKLNEKYFQRWFTRNASAFSVRSEDLDIHIANSNVYQDISNNIEMDSVGSKSSSFGDESQPYETEQSPSSSNSSPSHIITGS